MNDTPRTLFEVTPAGDQAGHSVGAVLTNLPAAQRRLAGAISSAVGLPRSGIGLTAAAKAVGAAAEAIGCPGLRSQSGALQQALELGTGRDAAFDLALLLEGHRDHVVAAVLLRPDSLVSSTSAPAMRWRRFLRAKPRTHQHWQAPASFAPGTTAALAGPSGWTIPLECSTSVDPYATRLRLTLR